MIVTQDKIVNGLRNLGLGKGDLVTMHSSLKSLGCVEGGGQTVIRALLEAIGPEGTILMPAFSFGLKPECEPIFDVRETPSCVGLITEIFRREYATHRSIHLSHSYRRRARSLRNSPFIPWISRPAGKTHRWASSCAAMQKFYCSGSDTTPAPLSTWWKSA